MEIVRNNTQLKKHVGTVHTAAALTLVQRKAFSVMVFNAYPKLLKDRTHQIPIDVLCELTGFDSKNVGALEAALEELSKTVIKWEEGEGKNRKWAITTFCAYAIIEKGVCTYEFSEFLSQQLYKPEIYARINIGLIRDFQSRYGLALYENCARYRPNKEFRGCTPEWTLDQFRRLMGAADSALYDTFKELNRRIIKPAVIEVNAHSDIVIEPLFVKRGKNVVGISFEVRDNPQMKLNFQQESMENPLAQEVYDRYRVPHLKAIEWLDTHGEERFKEVLQMTNDLVAKGKAKSPVGFMRRAFEENYMPTVDMDAERKKLRAANASEEQTKKAAARKLAARQEAEHELETLYQGHLTHLAIERYRKLSEGERQAYLDALSEENFFFKDALQKKGRGDVMEGSLKLLLTHYLEEQWNLAQSLSKAQWLEDTGYRIEENGKGFSVIKPDAS